MTQIDPEQLKLYYQKYFPIKEFDQWLHSNLSHREFSFTLSIKNEEIYGRFKSYSSIQELKMDLIKKTPIKIDIGAVYNIKPKEKKSIDANQFVPLRRELVFDIDMNDYDTVRTCCEGPKVCGLCWQFMTCAIQILDHQLRNDFGFHNLLWIFSGRRGVHCWVCDDRAMKLSKEERSALVGYMSYKGDATSAKALHPSLENALKPCSNLFLNTLLPKMGILDNETQWQKVLALIPDDKIRKELNEVFPSLSNGKERWDQIRDRVKQGVLKNIIFKYTYPRLDVHVSTGLNHLLKSPFSIHPATGIR
jgi:DNA primase small subunit